MKGKTNNELFSASLVEQPFLSVTMKYNTIRAYGCYQHFVFVEGSSDRRFYSQTGNKELAEKAYYLYAVSSDEERGKEAVCRAFAEIQNNKNLRRDADKCIFIIDRDWELQAKMPFWVTKGHSMENYFIQRQNLETLFKCIPESDPYETERFQTLFERFARETSRFWALKATLVHAGEIGIHCPYRKKKDFEQIFHFRYQEKTIGKPSIRYDRKCMTDEMTEMEAAISISKDLQNYCRSIARYILNDPQLVRGHDAFRFLQCYVEGRFHVLIDLLSEENDLLSRAIPGFEVELCR